MNLPDPTPTGPWIGGTIAATSARVAQGGPYYESPTDSLYEATLPYPPGSLLIVSTLAELAACPPSLAVRFIGAGSVLLLLALATAVAIRLGTPPLAAFAFTLLVVTLFLQNVSVQMLFSYMPDGVLLCAALGIAVLAGSLRTGKVGPPLAMTALLFIAAVHKAQALGIFVGVALFALCAPEATMRSRLSMLLCTLTAGLLAVYVLLRIPSCYESCVVAMAAHPRSLQQLLSETKDAAFGLWPWLAIAAPGACVGLRRVRTIWAKPSVANATALLLLCMAAPYSLLQVFAAMKYGGGAYNLEFAFLLLLPFWVTFTADALRLRRQATVVALMLSLAFSGLLIHRQRRSNDADRQRIETCATYLRSRFPGGRTMYCSLEYDIVAAAGLTPATDLTTAWHYRTGGFRSERLMSAVRGRDYDLVLFRDPAERWPSSNFLSFLDLIQEHYVADASADIPEQLKGRLLIPRARVNEPSQP